MMFDIDIDVKKHIQDSIDNFLIKLNTENVQKISPSDSVFNTILMQSNFLDVFKEYFNDFDRFSEIQKRRMIVLLVMASIKQKEPPDQKTKTIRILLIKWASFCSNETIFYMHELVKHEKK
ncbi:MAG: hypothetical protein RBG13Loki_0862, partial [Promethearchaeota archaeon CR_4]